MINNRYIKDKLDEANEGLAQAKRDVSATCSRLLTMKFDGIRFNNTLTSLKEDVAFMTHMELKAARLNRIMADLNETAAK